MRPRFLATVLFLATAISAVAQEEPQEAPKFKYTYSVELGTGIQPVYMNTFNTPSREVQEQYADKGQKAVGPYKYPVISLTGVLRVSRRSEHILTLGAVWIHHQIMQYPWQTGGFDPEGKPRYNFSAEGTIVGSGNNTQRYSITWQWRHLWTPDRLIVLYSGLGLGIVFSSNAFSPLPALTPLGLRIGGKHFYGFAETTIGPYATLAHGGLGWRF